MALKISVGKKLVKKTTRDVSNNLKIIYETPNLLIQGDDQVNSIKSGSQLCVIFVGMVLGQNQLDGSMKTLNSQDDEFNQLLINTPLEILKNEIEGRFIIVKISDTNEVEICADKNGQMDVYYQNTEDGAVFATDLSLFSVSNSSFEFNQVALAHSCFVYGFRPGKKQTIYSEVHRMGVQQTAKSQNGKIRLSEFTVNLESTNNDYGEKDLLNYSQILLDAIEQRSSKEGNVVYLSSGWDSTSILAHLVKIHGPAKVTGIIGRMNFSERRGVINQFELDRAKDFADYYGIKLEIVEYDYVKRGHQFLEEMIPFLKSQMLAGMSAYFWDDLAKYVSIYHKGKSVFCGEISDGVHNFGFAQYATILNHPDLGFREYADKMGVYLFGPSFLNILLEKNHNNDLVYNLLKGDSAKNCFDEPANDIGGVIRQLMSSMFLRDKRIPLWSIKNSKIFTKQGSQRYVNEMEKMYINDLAKMADENSLYACYQHLYNSFHWQGATVSSLCFSADKYGFEMNLPFYDSRIHSFLSKMPENWGRGLDLRPPKYPLKWTLQNRLDYPIHLQKGPHSYLYDIDPNFSHAGEFIYSSSFTPFIKETLKKRKFLDIMSPEIFNLEYYDTIVDNYLKGKEITSERSDLSALCFLSIGSWY